jgi:metal-responsive CopG/Arc/MetJ family transcriptional regulator
MPRNKSRKTVHLQLETELLDKVDALAKKQERSRLNLIRWLVVCELERYDERSAEASRTPEASAGEGAAA